MHLGNQLSQKGVVAVFEQGLLEGARLDARGVQVQEYEVCLSLLVAVEIAVTVVLEHGEHHPVGERRGPDATPVRACKRGVGHLEVIGQTIDRDLAVKVTDDVCEYLEFQLCHK